MGIVSYCGLRVVAFLPRLALSHTAKVISTTTTNSVMLESGDGGRRCLLPSPFVLRSGAKIDGPQKQADRLSACWEIVP